LFGSIGIYIIGTTLLDRYEHEMEIKNIEYVKRLPQHGLPRVFVWLSVSRAVSTNRVVIP
jgi:hypothetical protein